MKKRERNTISISPLAAKGIDGRRGSHTAAEQVSMDLFSYWALLDNGMRIARAMFTPDEARMLLESMKALDARPSFFPVLIGGKFAEDVRANCGVLKGTADYRNVEVLVEKLGAVSPIVTLALMDWIQSYWRQSDVSIEEAVREFRG